MGCVCVEGSGKFDVVFKEEEEEGPMTRLRQDHF